MKKYAWIKQESDAEIYEVNGQYIKVVWGYSKGNDTGWHNEFDTDVCVYRWTGEECEVDELPGAMDSDWKANGEYIKVVWGYATGSETGLHNTAEIYEVVVGFDLSTKENSYGNPEVDWDEYAKKVDEILAEIEEEQTKEGKK